MLRCLCCAKAYTNIIAKAFINPIFLSLHELSRFIIEEQSEECAFSGQIDFSTSTSSVAADLAGAKIDKFSFGWREKKQIFHKSAGNTVSIWRILVFLRRDVTLFLIFLTKCTKNSTFPNHQKPNGFANTQASDMNGTSKKLGTV